VNFINIEYLLKSNHTDKLIYKTLYNNFMLGIIIFTNFFIKSGRTSNMRYPENLQADIQGVKAKKK
jgi:hypothetical protein